MATTPKLPVTTPAREVLISHSNFEIITETPCEDDEYIETLNGAINMDVKVKAWIYLNTVTFTIEARQHYRNPDCDTVDVKLDLGCDEVALGVELHTMKDIEGMVEIGFY